MPRLIPSDEIKNLLLPISEKEIYGSLRTMNPWKNSGVDGFLTGFFVKCWDIVKQDCVNLIQKFFSSKQFDTSINHTLIARIPKIRHPIYFENYRRISLCTTLNKIIAQICISRMRPLVNKNLPFPRSLPLQQKYFQSYSHLS